MAQLSTEERIRRIELAPAEMQTRVAKAYLREDIDDEDVQYLYNEDAIETLCEENTIENINAEEPEGIGATGFSIRTSKPGAGNKHFIRTSKGGWSTCVKGNPTDSNCDVLANCVGYAQGRFNEIYNDIKGTSGNKFNNLNCNAENFIERAKAAGLEVGSSPRAGAIMCWQKGATLNSGDGAGHVAIVEKVNNSNSVYTSESGYGSSAFWNSTRTNSNGRWGANSAYSFRGFIYNPAVEEEKEVDPFPGVSDEELARRVWNGEFGNGNDRKNALGIRYSNVQALVEQGVRKPQPQPESEPVKVDPLAQYSNEELAAKVWRGEFGTGADRKNALGDRYDAVQALVDRGVGKPEVELHVGDTVKIKGTGNGSSNGNAATAYGIGWTRTILKVLEGKSYPYQVGNNSGTTGFYRKEALEKK